MVFLEHPPLQRREPPRRPPRRRPREKNATLAATDEFWFSPVQDDLTAAIDAALDADAASSPMATATDDADSDRGDAAATTTTGMIVPPAHPQLLSDEPASVEDLKGRDHTRCSGADESSRRLGERRDPSSARSWLLGFGSLTDDAAVGPDEREGAAGGAPPGGLPLDHDECSSSSSSSSCGDDDSLPSVAPVGPVGPKARRRGVSFDPSVVVRPIPPASELSPSQRLRMFSGSDEVRRNKVRNKVEFRHDGWDWRRASEEWDMELDVATGELVHPAHGASFGY